jgi:hypothetical protein
MIEGRRAAPTMIAAGASQQGAATGGCRCRLDSQVTFCLRKWNFLFASASEKLAPPLPILWSSRYAYF